VGGMLRRDQRRAGRWRRVRTTGTIGRCARPSATSADATTATRGAPPSDAHGEPGGRDGATTSRCWIVSRWPSTAADEFGRDVAPEPAQDLALPRLICGTLLGCALPLATLPLALHLIHVRDALGRVRAPDMEIADDDHAGDVNALERLLDLIGVVT